MTPQPQNGSNGATVSMTEQHSVSTLSHRSSAKSQSNGNAQSQIPSQNASDNLFPDLLSSDLQNGPSNGTNTVSAMAPISNGVTFPNNPQSTNHHENHLSNHHQNEAQNVQRPLSQQTGTTTTTTLEFDDFADPFDGDDGFGEFEEANTNTMSHTVDLLGDLDANNPMDTAVITDDVDNAEEAEPEDDFSKFVQTIKVEAFSLLQNVHIFGFE